MTPYTLNLIDMAFTLYALQHGGEELNPLMRNPAVMVAYKTVVVGLFCAALSVLAKDKRVPTKAQQSARMGLKLSTAVYAVLSVYHLYFALK